MPYVITTTERSECWDRHTGATITQSTRHAVATLEEARRAITVMHAHAPSEWPDLRPLRDALTDEGGTIGPLPDGTIIEVSPASLSELWASAGHPKVASGFVGHAQQSIIDAYNAAQS